MKDLIERLEKCSGPDRELDLAIAVALDSRAELCSQYPDWSPHKFTASIDAALTLVPEGCVWALNFASMATIIRPGTSGVLDGVEVGQWPANQTEAEHPVTPAIALCIAALRARLTVVSGGRDG